MKNEAENMRILKGRWNLWRIGKVKETQENKKEI